MQILFYLKNNINFYNIVSYLEKVYRVSNIEIHFSKYYLIETYVSEPSYEILIRCLLHNV
jgi:hypothetical protein